MYSLDDKDEINSPQYMRNPSFYPLVKDGTIICWLVGTKNIPNFHNTVIDLVRQLNGKAQ